MPVPTNAQALAGPLITVGVPGNNFEMVKDLGALLPQLPLAVTLILPDTNAFR